MKRQSKRPVAATTFVLLAGALALAAAPVALSAQGKTTTESYTDTSRRVNIEKTKDANGNVVKEKESDLQGKPLNETDREFDKNGNCTKETEKDGAGTKTQETETEYNKDGSVKKRTIRRFYPNGKKRSETVITHDPDGGAHGATQSWDAEGNPDGKGKGRLHPAVSANIAAADSGLRTVTFSSPAGAIHVYLPSDMAAGDTISGTVTTEPAGRSEDERAANAAELNGYVLETGDKTGSKVMAGKVITFGVPAGIATLPLWLSHGGAPVDRIDVGVAPTPSPVTPAFAAPQVAQAGRPITVCGPFDGDLANTRARLGDQPMSVLAESPRSMIVTSPRDVIGPARLTVEDGGNSAETTVHNLAVGLSTPKTTLMRGEETIIRVRVEGLEGMPTELMPLSLQVVNQSPSVIRLEGANSPIATRTIAPANIEANGKATFNLPVRGLTSGAFQMKASLPATRAVGMQHD